MNECEHCGLPGHHKKSVCFKELMRRKQLGDTLFSAAVDLCHRLGDPVDPKNSAIADRLVALELETWHWAS